MGLMQYMLIFATIMVFVVIYLGVRDQYKSQEEITKRNYELERYYDSIKIQTLVDQEYKLYGRKNRENKNKHKLFE